MSAVALRNQAAGVPRELQQALEAALQLAIARHQSGDIAAAAALYARVLAADVRHPVALHNSGLIRLAQGDLPAALLLLGAAVEEKPQEPAFQFNLGLARQTAGDSAGAVAAYRQALRYKPDYRKAWENLGVALQDQEQYEDAVQAYRRALAIDGSAPVAHKNLGNVLRTIGRLDEAGRQYEAALDCNPLDGELALQAGSTRLSQGDFTAWDLYERRYCSAESLDADKPYHVPLPKWDGSSLAGRSLLLYGEQGVGDEIMFASCVPDVAAQAASTALLCDPRLVQLFRRSFPGVTVEGRTRGKLPPVLNPTNLYELRSSLASLPQHLRRTESAFPKAPYLVADAAATARWHQRLREKGARLVVGLSWQGGSGRARVARSIALQRLAPLFDDSSICFVNLQYGDHRDEIASFNAVSRNPLVSFDDVDPLRELDDFAALIAAMDCVISVDNSTAHLAGALGTPTWLLLPFHADWRWVRNREDTVWYRSLRLFWQQAPGRDAWSEVIQRVRAGLAGLSARSLRQAEAGAPVPASSQSTARLTAVPDVLLLNDTAYWYHWGCSCTSLALHDALRSRGLAVDPVSINEINTLSPLPATAAELDDEGLYQTFCAGNAALVERMRSVSVVMINGEGSIHDLGQTARALLYLAYIAKRRFGKHTRIVNHSSYPSSGGGAADAAESFYRKVYEAMDFVAVREAHSSAQLRKLGVDPVEAFDCLPLFVARHPPEAPALRARRVVIAGSALASPELVDFLAGVAELVICQGYEVVVLVGANAYLAHDDVQLLAALQQRLRGRYRLAVASSEAQWLDTLSDAALLISGRFHYSIAAACVGTPFLVTASNTPKIDGMLQRLGLSPEQVWISPRDFQAAAARVEAILRDPQLGVASAEALESVREMTQRNFLGLTT